MPPKINALILAVGLILLGACTTVTPHAIESHIASFDGNEQNSGIISVNANGWVVTPHLRDRYNALVKIYGGDFKPRIEKDDGIRELPSGNYLLDKQHAVYFLEMVAWQRAGLKPVNP